jgi:hypothetical protein
MLKVARIFHFIPCKSNYGCLDLEHIDLPLHAPFDQNSGETQSFLGVRQLAAAFVTHFHVAAKAQASLRTPNTSPYLWN